MSKHINATTLRALLLIALPGTRLLICDGECYLIRKSAPKHLTARVYDALSYAGYISQPQAIGGGLAQCLMTPEGYAKATKIREAMSEYYQLCLFDEEIEQAEESMSAETQLCLFDEKTEGAA